MKGYSLALAAALLLALVGDHVIFAQNPPCDPDHDRRNPNLQAAKEAKKAQLRRAGYPERFMKLIDQEECIACVRLASDAFHIMIVYKDNAYAPTDPKTGNKWTHISTNWDPESELIAREKTKDGTIKGYYILNTLKRDCKCCPEIDDNKHPEDYSDWDEDLQANKNHLIPFDQSNTTGPPPDDLINPPPQWINDPVPNIETFQKPPRKQVSAPCPQCAGEALKLNDAYRALDELWDLKISLLNDQSILENGRATRRNEISSLYYRQRSALTRTPDGLKQIENAERAQEADFAQMRANVLELDRLTAQITNLMAAVAKLEQALIACAAKCATTAENDAIPATPGVALPVGPPASPPPVPPSPTGGRRPAGTTGIFSYFESKCSVCDGPAAAARSAAEALQRAERFRDLLQESLDEKREELAQLQKANASMKPVSAGVDASKEFVVVTISKLEEEIGPLGLQVEVAKTTVSERRAKYQEAIDELDKCNARCGTVTETPPSSTFNPTFPAVKPTSGAPPREVPAPDPISGFPGLPFIGDELKSTCPGCDEKAEAAQAALRAAQTALRERNAYRADLDRKLQLEKDMEQRAAELKAQTNQAGNASLQFLYAELSELRELIRVRSVDLPSVESDLANKRDALIKAFSELDACNRRCTTPPEIPRDEPVVSPDAFTQPSIRPVIPPSTNATVVSNDNPPSPACFGDSCGNDWNICDSSDSCRPVEDDCGIPGVCEEHSGGSGGGGFAPLVNFTDGFTWTPPNIRIEIRIQIKIIDLLDPALYPQFLQQVPGFGPALVIQPATRQGVRQWFDPLGLLVRRMVDQIERWRGSVGPRPLIKARDLHLIDRASNVQAAGLPKGVHLLLSDQGGSTGKTLVMNVLNLSGQPVRLSSKPFAVEPIQQQEQQQVLQAFSRLSQAAPVRLDLAAYCVEFLKAPPGPSTLLRLAPASVQQKYASMSKILQSAYRVSKGNALHPDSNPAAYTDAMKQWSIWVVEQNLNEARFTEAFLGHTKKNVEAAKQQWSKQADDTIRAASPNRWRDIVKILQGAGVPVPR